jgi:hypothetical protein
MALTYEPISTSTLGSASSTISFTSIPNSYTDLKVVLVANGISATTVGYVMTFNSDTAANYTFTQMLAWGISGSVGANRNANQTNIRLSGRQIAPSATLPSLCEVNIFNYTGANFKPVFIQHSESQTTTGVVTSSAGMWRSTSAITSITFTASNQFNTGSTATLYGIKAA